MALCYAYVLTIFAPSQDALIQMHALCEQYALSHGTSMLTRLNLYALYVLQLLITSTSHSVASACLWLIRLFTLGTLYSTICLISWILTRKKRYLPLQLDEKLEVCHCAGRPFRRIPLLISSTGQRPDVTKQPRCTRLVGAIRPR